jgi:CheY-like chemotaxis protein
MNSNRLLRVAVVDDDPQGAAVMLEVLEDAGYSSFHVEADNPTLDALVNQIRTSADAAICDHRLRYGAFGDFSGSELAARLIEANIPTIVVTQYLDQEASVGIRTYRERIPVVLKRSDAEEPEHLRAAIEASQRELKEGPSAERAARRALIHILERTNVGNDTVLDVIVEGWNALDAVRFPLAIVPESMRNSMQVGARFFVETNLAAGGSDELYFTDFEPAPEPDPSDGLA